MHRVRTTRASLSSTARRAATMAALALAGCAIVRGVTLPAPDEGAHRESPFLSSYSCRPGRCQESVKLGEERLRLETRTRRLSVNDLPGQHHGLVHRAASATGNWLLRQVGGYTEEEAVFTGTRTVTGGAEGRWRATCDFAWVDEVTREKADEPTKVLRMREGQDCRVVAVPETTVVRWRFRRGVAPVPDSLSLVLDTLAMPDQPNGYRLTLLSLQRFEADGRDAGGYTVATDTSRSDWFSRPALWRVARSDGVRIASLYVGARVALDLEAAASAEEAAVLRLIAAAVMTPIEYP